MATVEAPASDAKNAPVETYDAIIIGAGMTGIGQLYHLRSQGLNVRLLERGGGVGGTWYWHRYPGCCFDSESETYAFGFSKELAEEWDWSEHFEAQPNTERYINYAVDKFGLREHIQLNAQVDAATWLEDDNVWELELSDGARLRARFVVAALGILSAAAHYIPDFEGLEDFKGEWLHPANWPHEPIDFAGKRVGVIGTGSTGVQITEQLAKVAGQLHVFQRTPTYIGPLHNGPVSAETQREWKDGYEELMEFCRNTPAGFRYVPDMRPTMSVSKEERWAFYERLWQRPGFEKWLANFFDVTLDAEANADFAEFFRGKIRERIHDPELAEKLVPSPDLPFGSRRIPLETSYYDAFNRDNVSLVDLRETSIERFTENGILTSDGEVELDFVIFATGYDSFTGGFDQIDIRGVGGRLLREKWQEEGIGTYLGLTVAGFPNFFTQVPRAFCNFPRCSEVIVDWVSALIARMNERGLTRFEATQQAHDDWVEHERSFSSGQLFASQDSWFNGGNIPGKAKGFLLYAQSLPGYRTELHEALDADFRGFEIR